VADQRLKRPDGTTFAIIRTVPDGEQRIYLPNGTHLGTYRPASDRTYLPNGSMIGIGNLLTTLVHQAERSGGAHLVSL